MWWECSECGGSVEQARAPVHCRECGTAGIIFVPIEVREGRSLEDEDCLRSAWLRAGADRNRPRAEAWVVRR